MNTQTELIFPHLTTAEQYINVLTRMLNTVMHEPLMIRRSGKHGGRIANARIPELNRKIAAAKKEGEERFGHKAMNKGGYCSKCDKFRVNKFQMDGGATYNPELHCHRGRCGVEVTNVEA